MTQKFLFYRKIQILERQFSVFLLDLANLMETDITLPRAIKSLSNKDYGKLTKYIQKLNKKISWSKSFPKAFIETAEETKSDLIKKSVSVIIGGYEAGGDIKKMFKSISVHIKEIINIRSKRYAESKTIEVTCYIIFICLLFGSVAIRKFFTNPLTEFSSLNPVSLQDYKVQLFHLAIIQSIATGLIIGQISENNLFAGFRHSVMFLLITFFVFGIFT
jgi:flagellar protein FlaJ